MTRKLGKVLVTGADGFIGSHLVELLVGLGAEVTALCVYNSRGSFGWLDSLRGSENVNFVLGDVRDPSQMNHIVKGHSTVFHLASLIAIPYSYEAPTSYIDTNVKGTLNILEAAKHAGVSRVVHTSTSEVYGTALYTPIDEKHELQPQSPYSASKIAADMVANSYHSSFGLPVTTLRPFNTYGPRQSLRAVIPTVIAQVLSGSKKLNVGSLDPIRDFNYVDDTARAFVELALAKDEVLGETYNTGTGVGISIGDMIKMVFEASEIDDIEIVEESVRFRPKKSEVMELIGSSTKLQNISNWKPEVSMKQGLVRTMEWMSGTNFKDNDCSKYVK